MGSCFCSRGVCLQLPFCLQRSQEEHEKQTRAHKVELRLLHLQMDEACGAFDSSLQVRRSSTWHSIGEAAYHTELSGMSARVAGGVPCHVIAWHLMHSTSDLQGC